jgi:hypothetical protein
MSPVTAATDVPRSLENASSMDSTVGVCIEPNTVPGGVEVSCKRGTPERSPLRGTPSFLRTPQHLTLILETPRAEFAYVHE